jgi:membrane protease YdiL (CAAX protease family)
MGIIKTIRESIITRWIVLYYTFFFILGSYLLLQIVFTAAQFLFFKPNPDSVINIHGFYVDIDGVSHQIWDLPQFYIAIIGSTIIITVVIYFLTRLISNENTFSYLGFNAIERRHYIWFLYMVIVLTTGILLNEMLLDKTPVIILAETTKDKVLLVLGLVFFAPFLEELLYRGFLLSRMDTILGGKKRWIPIVVSAFFFASFHFQYNPIELTYIFVVGVFLAIMRFKTNTLWLPIIFHFVGNLYPVLNILL